MQYNLPVNLQQIALLKMATSFWKKKDVKDRVTEFFKSYYKFETSDSRSEWCKLTKTVLDEWEKDSLPQHLYVKLIHIIKMTGISIFSWCLYIKYQCESINKVINCIDQIHWTPYGTVDAVKTFKSFWLDNPNLEVTRTYNFACEYMMEEYIDDLWYKIPEKIRKFFFSNVYKDFDRHIVTYWKWRRDDKSPDLMRCLQETANRSNQIEQQEFNLIYDLNRSLEENMLRLSIHQGYLIAMKYFWEKCTEEEKNECVLKCARIAILSYCNYKNGYSNIKDYKINQCVEISIFLMNKMSVAEKKVFFNQELEVQDGFFLQHVKIKDEILCMLLSSWPWQELFILVLKDLLQYEDDNSMINCMFLDTITNKMLEDHKLGYSLEISRYRYLLREAWLIVPASFKQNVNHRGFFIKNLISVWDRSSLRFILNDPEIVNVRNRFISSGSQSFMKLAADDQFEKLDQFIEDIFKSEEEKKLFKQTINVGTYFISKGRFDLVEKLLNWKCSTLEERQSIKNNIDYIQICKVLIEMERYDLADEYLNWQFETENERRSCKNHFKNDIFSMKQIAQIWVKNIRDINEAKKKCTEFLHWFLESKEEITLFKKGITVISADDQDLLLNSMLTDDLISWCLVDDE